MSETETRRLMTGEEGRRRWGLIPAAGAGTRIQPLAFSKELLPVGARVMNGRERPRAVSEFLLERMQAAGADRLCFVWAPNKCDILHYYRGRYADIPLCYVIQAQPKGLCDALFCARPFIGVNDSIMVGLPDTIWFPQDGFKRLDEDRLSLLLFHVAHPEFFDAVLCEGREVREIQVKTEHPNSNWIWGAFQLPGGVFEELYRLWLARDRRDEYMGTLINAYIHQGGRVSAVAAGRVYADVGTLHGYRAAVRLLGSSTRLRVVLEHP